MKNGRSRNAVTHGALGLLITASIGIHLHHVLTGAQAFWVPVTLLMTLFCLVSSTQLGGAGTAAFFAAGVTLGLCFEALSIRTGFPFGPYYYTAVFGPGVMGVPFIIPLAWYVIVYLGYIIANLMIRHQPVVPHGGAGEAAFLAHRRRSGDGLRPRARSIHGEEDRGLGVARSTLVTTSASNCAVSTAGRSSGSSSRSSCVCRTKRSRPGRRWAPRSPAPRIPCWPTAHGGCSFPVPATRWARG